MSRVHRFRDGMWEDIEIRPYKPDPKDRFRNIARMVLAGDTSEEQIQFQVRYFVIEPGGYSSLERHQHEHVVIVLEGEGEVLLEDQVIPIQPFDLIRIGPWTLHRFRNRSSTERFGFLCVVDRMRDRPQIPSAEEIEKLKRDPNLRDIVDPEDSPGSTGE